MHDIMKCFITDSYVNVLNHAQQQCSA